MQNTATYIRFSESKKGQAAEKKYNSMLKKGFETLGALEILVIHGYAKEIETNLYV